MIVLNELSGSISKSRYLFEVIYRPIMWGLGTAALVWIGFSEIDMLTAFFVGLCVGLVHDLYLVSIGVMAYKPRIVGIAYHNKFVEAMKLFEARKWQQALDLLEEILEVDALAKEPLYFAIKCSENLERWDLLSMYSERYLKQYPDDQEVQDRLRLALDWMNNT